MSARAVVLALTLLLIILLFLRAVVIEQGLIPCNDQLHLCKQDIETKECQVQGVLVSFRAVQIVFVVLQGLYHTFAHERVCGKVNYCLYLFIP